MLQIRNPRLFHTLWGNPGSITLCTVCQAVIPAVRDKLLRLSARGDEVGAALGAADRFVCQVFRDFESVTRRCIDPTDEIPQAEMAFMGDCDLPRGKLIRIFYRSPCPYSLLADSAADIKIAVSSRMEESVARQIAEDLLLHFTRFERYYNAGWLLKPLSGGLIMQDHIPHTLPTSEKPKGPYFVSRPWATP